MAGGPYASKVASIGGVPTVGIDIPTCAVFLVIFIIGAASHMTILQTNLRRGHVFKVSGMIFGYCMARTVTCIMRIVWATRQHNIQIAIAANVFSSAGVFMAFLVNIILAQRMVCAAFPTAGTSKPFKMAFVAVYAVTVLTLISVITSVVQSVYTLDTYIHTVDRDIQLTGSTLILLIAALPLPLTLAAVLKARGTPAQPFGTGSWNAKVVVLLTTTLLALTVAGFRCGTGWMPVRPATNPYWFDARWCYYFFNFVFDISIIYTYLLTRVDQRFHIPGKAEGLQEEVETKADEGESGRSSYAETA